jgi:tetratricopeptide (TPR) repeat protein
VTDTVTIKGKAPGEADFFYTLDRVLGGLLAALKAGRIDEAVDVYSRCREDIGYQIISRAQNDPELFKQVANLFFRARDFARAAYCCENMEEHAKAAALYERCDDFAHAAQMYAAAGDRTKAAEMFEKDGNLQEAARLFRDLGEHMRSASCFERAGKHFDAATAWQRAGKLEKAIEVLNLVDEDSPDRKVANKVIKELMAQANLKRSQTGQIAAVNPEAAAPPTPSQSAPITQSARNSDDTTQGDTPSQVKTLVQAAPVSFPPVAPEPILVGGGQIGESGKGIVTVMEGFELLKDLPLFADLSLSELKGIYHLCDIKNAPAGLTLIAAGQPAPALFVVMSGEIEVKTPSGDHVTMLGIGQHAGEMSLVDDGPATVDVVTASACRVLRLDKRGFRDALAGNDGLSLRVMRVFLRVLTERLRETTARLGR